MRQRRTTYLVLGREGKKKNEPSKRDAEGRRQVRHERCDMGQRVVAQSGRQPCYQPTTSYVLEKPKRGKPVEAQWVGGLWEVSGCACLCGGEEMQEQTNDRRVRPNPTFCCIHIASANIGGVAQGDYWK